MKGEERNVIAYNYETSEKESLLREVREAVPADWSAVECCAVTMEPFIFGNYYGGKI